MKTAKMMLIVGIVLMGVQADVKEKKNASGFELLCNVTRAATGLWHTFFNPDEETEKLNELSETLNEIFFYSKFSEDHTGDWRLPDAFIIGNPKRSAVCGLSSESIEMPSASKSIVSAFFCLCTQTASGEESLCGLTGDGNRKWPNGESSESAKSVFEKVWGRWYEEGIREMCEAPHSLLGDLNKEKQNVVDKIKELENALTSGTYILGKSGSTCEASDACAYVTKEPNWLLKLKKFEEIANLTLLEALRQESESKRERKPLILNPPTPVHTSPAPAPSADPHQPAPLSVSTQDPVEASKREQRQNSPEEEQKQQRISQPEPKQKTERVPTKQEDSLLVPEPNETSGSYLTSHRWPLLVALLI